MSVSRGKFLKSLGSALPGMILGSGVAGAAQNLINKIAAPSESVPTPVSVENKGPAKTEFIKSGPTDGNRIALTFDDGPTPGVTEVILDELKKRNLTATFFMIGQRIAAAPELARRVYAEGHEIGNHTFTHAKLKGLSDQQVLAEIQKTNFIMDETLYHRPAWFRPPFGELRQDQSALLQREELGVILWSVDSLDWSQPDESKIVQTILAETKPGSIILCHDLHLQIANCIGEILDGLVQRGFTFVNISNLLNATSIK